MLKERNVKIFIENLSNSCYRQKPMDGLVLLTYITTCFAAIFNGNMTIFLLGSCISLYFTFKVNDLFNLEKNIRTRKMSFITGSIYLYSALMSIISTYGWMKIKNILSDYSINYKLFILFLFFILCCFFQFFSVMRLIKQSHKKNNVGDMEKSQIMAGNISKLGFSIVTIFVGKSLQEKAIIYILFMMIAVGSLCVKFFIQYYFIKKFEKL